MRRQLGRPQVWQLMRIALIGASVALWSWLQDWPVTIGLLSVLVLVGACAGEIAAGPVWRARWPLLVALAVLLNVAAFYRDLSNVSGVTDRLARVPHGKYLFTLSVLWALGASLFVAEESFARGLKAFAYWMIRHARSSVYGVSVLLIVTLAVDLNFIGQGIPFDYTKYETHPVSLYPTSYANVHAAERYSEDIYGKKFTQAKPPGVVRIVLNGASTMWGQAMPPDAKPAAVLQRKLSEFFPDRVFEVIAIPWSGKYQFNELVDSVGVIPRWDADLVVSFNGFNEVWYGEGSGRFEAMPFWQRELLAGLSVPPALAFFYAHSHFGAEWWRTHIATGAIIPNLVDPVLNGPPGYYDYLRTSARVLADHGIRYVFAFCPNAFELEPDHESENVKRDLVGIHSEVRQRRRLSSRIVESAGQQSYDVMAPLRGMTPSAAFLDECHLSRVAIEAIISDLARRIPNFLAAPLTANTGDQSRHRLAPLRLVSNASDGFYKVKAGFGAGVDGVRSSGEVGLLLGGPRLELPPGRYRVRWYGRVTTPGEVTASFVDGQKTLAERAFDLQPADVTRRIADLDASVDGGVNAFEYRLVVSTPGMMVSVTQVVFEELWNDDALPGAAPAR